MSQNDAPLQQGILGVRSFAVYLDSDSDAGSVRSNGVDSPPLERRPEEKDSARRATLAALGLVPGPPPPVLPSQQQQQQQQQQASSPVVTPRGGSPVAQGTGSKSPRDTALPCAAPLPRADLRRPSSPVQPVRSSGFSTDSWQTASHFNPSVPSAGRPLYSNSDSEIAASEGLPADENMTSSLASHRPGTNHTGSYPLQQRAPMNALQEVEAAEAAAPLLSSAGVDRTSSGGAMGTVTASTRDPAIEAAATSSPPPSSSPSLVPSSPFQAVQLFDQTEPFVTPVVPPIRTKGTSPSLGATVPAMRHSSRFQERFTSPTTTRIVDELLDEVVAHRLTPRDSISSGRHNEHPARPRGRGIGEDDEDLPRVKPVPDIPKGAGHGSTFRDLDTAMPSAAAAIAPAQLAAAAVDAEAGSSRASSQALLEERSASIGEELKMVMKSERGGRLARDSAEILVGDKPGEFTVVTEEGSSIPIAVSDLASAASASTEPAAAVASPCTAAGASSVGMGGPAGSEGLPQRNWWGSMTAALGLKADAGPPVAAGERPGFAQEGGASVPVEHQPTPVSAFARDVAVKPVSVETADSSAVQGAAAAAAASGSVLVLPPVKDVSEEETMPQPTGSEPLSLESLNKLAEEAAAVPADAEAGRHSMESTRTGRASSRRASFQMETAASFKSDISGTVPDPSHRISLDMSGVPEGSALAAILESSGASATASPFAAAQQPAVTAERTGSEAAFLEAMPLEMPMRKKKTQPAVAQPILEQQPPPPARPAVVAERTRSEIAFDEALPLERPGRRTRPASSAAAATPAASKTSPHQDSTGATWDNAVPLELTRKRGGAPGPSSGGDPAAASSAAAPALAELEEKSSAWEQAVPLEASSSRSVTRSMPTSPTIRAELPASPPPQHKLGRSSSRGSHQPPPHLPTPAEFSDEADFANDPDLARSNSLDSRLPLIENLHGHFSLESSGTERYDIYIDRAAAYAKAQEGARRAALAAGRPGLMRHSLQGSLDSTGCVTRRVPHMGGIAAGTHAPQLRGLHRGAAETEPEPEPEPDIEMPEVDTPTSETDSEENEGEALFFTGREKGADSGPESGNNMHGLVGVSHASPPPSAFASAQPPRSVFADAQMPTSDSEAETERGASPAGDARGTTMRAESAGTRQQPLVEGKLPGNGRTDLDAEKQSPDKAAQAASQKRGFLCCFSRPATK